MSCLPRPTRAFRLLGNQKIILWTAVLWIGLCFPGLIQAQFACSDATVPGVSVEYIEETTLIPSPNTCNLLPCHKPQHTGTTVMGNMLKVGLKFPGNHQFITNNHVRFYWFNQATPPPGNCLPPPYGNCNPIAVCGLLGAEILTDVGTATLQVSCPAFAAAAGSKVFSISAYACQTFSGECTQKLDIPDLNVWNSLCRQPPRCEEKCGACAYGGGTGGGPGGPGAPGAGRGATLRYRAGGAGEPAFAGAALWRTTLGRYWSHDYAERIIQDPDSSHVWLITQHATFREFIDANGDGSYERNIPTDEYRRLRRTPSGWELVDLQGNVQSFDAQGRWTRIQDVHGNAKNAFYSGGQLTRVDMPDGRSETFSYHPGGKLAAITEVGVDGTTSRAWSYAWTGDDLARIDTPDGRAWTFRYDDPRLPGYMTRMTLVGTGGSERVEGAWEYDAQGNLIRSWKGDASPSGPGATEVTSISYDNPYLPRESRVTDPLGKVTTYTVGRDSNGQEPRLEKVSGDCPACGLGPNSQMSYDDPAHPLLKTREVDGRGAVTLYTYDANGRMTSKTEAFGTPLQRTATWEYNASFPGLVTEMEQPSTSGTGSRRALFTYDPEGSLLTQTVEGVEAGSAFHLTTTYRYNDAGQLEETDPPGYATQDVTRFAYDPARGNLIPASRTDPQTGTARFEYDAWNRQTIAIDPNGARTLTSYDNLDRVTAVTQEGETPAENLTTRYEHNALGDLARTVLPEGNLIEYGYDTAGRLVSVERKPDRATPGERTLYTFDAYGHRIREDLQRWDGSAWVTASFTAYEYSTRCRLDKTLHADGSVTEYAYDCEGNLERTWDANHPSNGRSNPASMMFEYDLLDRVAAVSQPWTGAGGGRAVTRYEYDVQDHVARITDAEGNVTRLTYSDRDLITQQVSEVSGTTEYRYNEHGKLTSETDARGTTVTRSLDALGRLTFLDFPEDALDTRFTWEDPLVPFSKGHLTAVIRNGGTVAYRYDRFGRILQDGALVYGYDRNGNRQTIEYPGGLTASYSFDFADREKELAFTEPGQAPKTIASEAAYLPNGPLTSLILGNGLPETRTFDPRYLPLAIQVAGKLEWQYTTDRVGNVLSIADGLDPTKPRNYSYQDFAYFLTQGNGPWGNLAWSYDKIGNRLTQTRNGATETYSYLRSSGGGNTPRLTTVTPATPGATPTSYFYDAAGQQTYKAAGAEKQRSSYSAERRLSQVSADAAGQPSAMLHLSYDGRGFLEMSALSQPHGAAARIRTRATYSSEGMLYHKLSISGPGSSESRDEPATSTDHYVFYFAGRPVALLEKVSRTAGGGERDDSSRLLYLTADHLGTPVLATDASGNTGWAGGFSPFGEDYARAGEAGIFLRFPGQWDDVSWQQPDLPLDLRYNVFRWLSPATGRYGRPDPVFTFGSEPLYAYARSNPMTFVDPLGLANEVPPLPGRRDPFKPPFDPTFSSGPWGRRPDKECCDPEKVKKRTERIPEIIKDLEDDGLVEVGPGAAIGGSVISGHEDKGDGWYVLYPLGPFEPGCKLDDPCLSFCCRVHEWFHYTDRRWYNINWDFRTTVVYGEKPAYEIENACLKSFF